MIDYNKKLHKKMKTELQREHKPIFASIKKYFLMFHKVEHSWIQKFEFLKQMRPRERNLILEYTFANFFKVFKSFFNGLDTYFKHGVALNLVTRFRDKNDKTNTIIKEWTNNSDTNENKNIKYFYFIGKGTIAVFKNNIELARLQAGSNFGDEYLLNKHPQFTYKCVDSDTYLFCCPVKLIAELCYHHEDSYMMLLYKSQLKMNKFKLIYKEICKASLDVKRSRISMHDRLDRRTEEFLDSNSENKVNSINSESKLDFISKRFAQFNSNMNRPNSINEVNLIDNKEECFNDNDSDHYDCEEEDNNMVNANGSGHDIDKLFEQRKFLHQLEINKGIFEFMIKLKEKKKKYIEYLKYTNTIEKKLEYLKNQFTFIKFHYGTDMDKSKEIIKSIKNN